MEARQGVLQQALCLGVATLLVSNRSQQRQAARLLPLARRCWTSTVAYESRGRLRKRKRKPVSVFSKSSRGRPPTRKQPSTETRNRTRTLFVGHKGLWQAGRRLILRLTFTAANLVRAFQATACCPATKQFDKSPDPGQLLYQHGAFLPHL